MTATALPRAAVVRDARPGDNDALLALAAACPMEGEIGMSVHREPDFFALHGLEGRSCRVGVAESEDGDVIGCVAAAERESYVFGHASRTAYVGDLKVAPRHRGGPAAGALYEWARAAVEAHGGPSRLLAISILAGNRRMERRATAPDAHPRFTRTGTVRACSIPLLFPVRSTARATGLTVERARTVDLEEMIALWRRVAPRRQLAPVLDEATLLDWIARAPGLSLGDYWLARRRDGRLAGFVALWNQAPLKQLVVTRWSPRLRAVRHVVNALAPLVGASELPAEGEPLAHATIANLCVPADGVATLAALLRIVAAESRAAGLACVNVGLDARDPLLGALRGLFAQPTDVGVWIATPSGEWAGPALDDRPLYHEIALV